MATNVKFSIHAGNVPSNYTLSLKNVSKNTTKTIDTTNNVDFGSATKVEDYEVTIPKGFYPTRVAMGISPSLITQEMPMTWTDSTRVLTFKAPNSALISNGGNSYGFIYLAKEPDDTLVRLNVSLGTGVTSNVKTTPEFPKGVAHFKFDVVEGKRFVDNRVTVKVTGEEDQYFTGDTENARTIEFDFDVQKVTTMIAKSEDIPDTRIAFTENLATGITSNTGGSTVDFPEGAFDFELNISNTFKMFETDGRENEVKLVQGSTTYYKTLKPYQNSISFTEDIQESFSLVAGIKDKPTGKYTRHLTRCHDNWEGARENFPYGVWSVTFTANENTVFKVNGKLIMTDPDTNEIIYEDTIVPPMDSTEFTYTLDNELGGLVGNVEIFMLATSTIVQASSFLRVYNVTDEEMTQVAQDRFLMGMVDGHIEILVDKGKNIVRIMNIPFEIPEDMLTPSTIKLGVYNTGIQSNELSDYRVSFDVGTISVPHKYNNVLDFVNTELELYLPYTDPITLEPNYVIGRDIRVEYLMNMYNGDVDINVYSSLIPDIPFLTKSTNISMNIPFLPTEIYGIEQSNNLDELVNNNIDKAQIHVKRNVPVINEFGIPVNATDTLDKFTGYSEITNIKLNSRADRAEQAEIKSLLANGVILP